MKRKGLYISGFLLVIVAGMCALTTVNSYRWIKSDHFHLDLTSTGSAAARSNGAPADGERAEECLQIRLYKNGSIYISLNP